MTCIPHQILLEWSSHGEIEGQGMWHISAYRALVSGEILKRILGKQDGGVWTGVIWPHQWQALVNTEWTFVFHKMMGIPWVAELASQGLSTIEFDKFETLTSLI
jgi:hypothetical protein